MTMQNNIANPKSPCEKGMDLTANLLSWILVPVFIPIYGMILIFTLSVLSMTTLPITRVLVTLVLFGINVAIPMALMLVLKRLKVISDVGLNMRRERPIPYLIVMLCYLASARYLYAHGAPDWVSMFFTGGGAAALINLIVNFKWKISAHAAGMGGVCALLVYIAHQMPDGANIIWLCVWVLLSGLLGAARIWLRRHTLLQVIAGFLNGYLCVALMQLIHY